MELLYYEDKRQNPAIVVHEPISKMAAVNGDHFRIYIQFTKKRHRLPSFGILKLNIENIRYRNVDEIVDFYTPVRNNVIEKYCDQEISSDDIFVLDFHIAANPHRLNLRLNLIHKNSGKLNFDNWSEWISTQFPLTARFLVEIDRNECRIFNGQAFNLYLINRLNFVTQEIECDICQNNRQDIVVYACGHGLCYNCYQELRKNRSHNQVECQICKCLIDEKATISLVARSTICPIDGCEQPKDEKFIFSPCGCMVYHNFKGREHEMIGQNCPYCACSKIIEEIRKVFVALAT